MELQSFFKESGFKVLAMTKLDGCEYSIIFYLLNCAASNINEFVTTYSELSSLTSYNENRVENAITHLVNLGIIFFKQSAKGSEARYKLFQISLCFDPRKWKVEQRSEGSAKDALVYPFRRTSKKTVSAPEDTDPKAKFKLVQGDASSDSSKTQDSEETWKRIYSAFLRDRKLDDIEVEKAEQAARILADTHSVDHALLLIRHFSGRIPSLSLLASSWSQYVEIYEHEAGRINLFDAKARHSELDDELRDKVEKFLNLAKNKMSEEELTVLNVILKHQYPRRQLYWAYQSRFKYPRLKDFLEDNKDSMLSITSSGQVVKKHDE